MAHSRCILEIYRQTAALNRGSILPIFKWSTLTGAPRTEKQAFVRCCQKPPVNFVHFSAPWIKFWSQVSALRIVMVPQGMLAFCWDQVICLSILYSFVVKRVIFQSIWVHDRHCRGALICWTGLHFAEFYKIVTIPLGQVLEVGLW